MGAWGTGIFENDQAMDFVGDLAEDPGRTPKALRKALRRVSRPRLRVSAPVGSEALAAAAIVSVARPDAPLARTDLIDEYAAAIEPHVPEGLAPAAVSAIDRVLGPRSELVTLWRESDALDAFRAEPLAIRAHLVAGA
jgi:hypothetical protein